MFRIGEFAPTFTDGSEFGLQDAAGKYVVLCFFGSTSIPYSRRVLDDIDRQGERLRGESLVFVGISSDANDTNLRPGREQGRYLCDSTHQLSRLYQVISQDGAQLQLQTLILDPLRRVMSVLPFDGDPESYVPRLLDALKTLPALQDSHGHAPILILPNVFEPEFCRTLIRVYEQQGGQDGATMRDVDGYTERILDHRMKSRMECFITDLAVQAGANLAGGRRMVPEVRRAFQFQAAWVERHLVACYDATMGGWFKAHRDNGNTLTAHRKFAFTINLNTDDYEGGDLWFPEYGSRLYRVPTGGAVVFSASLLHEAKPITRGQRYAYVSFLYDREGFVQRVIMELQRKRQAGAAQESGTIDVAQEAQQIVDAHLKKHGF